MPEYTEIEMRDLNRWKLYGNKVKAGRNTWTIRSLKDSTLNTHRITISYAFGKPDDTDFYHSEMVITVPERYLLNMSEFLSRVANGTEPESKQMFLEPSINEPLTD